MDILLFYHKNPHNIVNNLRINFLIYLYTKQTFGPLFTVLSMYQIILWDFVRNDSIGYITFK